MPTHLQSPIAAGDAPEGHFHKTLPHSTAGVADPVEWPKFLGECLKTVATAPSSPPSGLDLVKGGIGSPVAPPPAPALFKPGVTPGAPAAKFVGPLGGWAGPDGLGPDPSKFHMPPPPSITSKAIAAEMNELYWMAALRDVPFDQLEGQAIGLGAVNDVNAGYNAAFSAGESELRTLRDIPTQGGSASFTGRTLFRAGLLGEDIGPFISQFFLHDIAYGAQQIIPWQIPYRASKDYLKDLPTWLLAQDTGYDVDGDPYNQDNDFGKDGSHFEPPLPDGRLPRYYMRTMRDLCRFVNRDALHQAYFNAALLLASWNARTTSGNPVGNNPFAPILSTRQGGFTTLGGPELLALVSWVAAYALRTVWHQKWHRWLRLRPEAFGGLAELRASVLGPSYTDLLARAGTQRTRSENGTLLLPIAFSAGSPAHPSYGAGHATVAGACVTLLKAWFDGSQSFLGAFAGASRIDPAALLTLKQPADHPAYASLPDYTGTDAASITVEGELNKLAANVAMGRSMGGVHFRTDNTRSLRLGEVVTTVFLSNWVKTYAEKPKFGFNSFDGAVVTIDASGIVVNGSAPKNVTTVISDYNANGHI